MADILINGPDGQSTINNIPAWATEATQSNIENLLKGIGTKAQKIEAILRLQLKGFKEVTEATTKGDKEVKKLLEILDKNDKKSDKKEQQATKQLTDELEKLQKGQTDGLDQLIDLSKKRNAQGSELDRVLDNLNSSGGGLLSMAGMMGGAFNVLGFALGGVTKIIGTFGLALLGAVKYLTSQFTDTFQFLNNGLRQGTGGIIGLTHAVDNVATSANLAGMSLDEFGEFAQQNSKILRTLTARGFADLYSSTLIAKGGLLDIGMTADDAVESVMTELEYRRRFGMILTMEGSNLQTSLMRSARELRIFANAVGMSEQDLRDQSQIAEDHIDLMQSQAMAMGANVEAIQDNSRTISMQLAGAGLSDMINPLFESISKGTTGLSDDFVMLGQVAPELFNIVEGAAADFYMNGVLNRDLGKDIVNFMRNLSTTQIETISQMQIAGVEGAALLNNMRKNVQRLEQQQMRMLFDEFDDTRVKMLDTFNTLGFIVNQATSSIGDMAKTAILSALGFTKNSKGVVDFNKGITRLSKGIVDFTGDVFGKNSYPYIAMEQFGEYMNAMFGGEDDPVKLEKARKAFTSTINSMAESIGDSLNDMFVKGTLMDNIKEFFKFFFDEMILAFNTASAGALMSDAADRINTERRIAGKINSDQYLDDVGTVSGGFMGLLPGGDRAAITQLMFRDQVEAEADRLGISRRLSRTVAEEKFAFGDDSRSSNRIMSDLRSRIYGFDQLSVMDQKTLFNERVTEIDTFNKAVANYIEKMAGELESLDLDTHMRWLHDDWFTDFSRDNFDANLNALELATDINDKNMDLYKNAFDRFNAGAFDFVSGIGDSMYDTKENAQLVYDQVSQRLTSIQGIQNMSGPLSPVFSRMKFTGEGIVDAGDRANAQRLFTQLLSQTIASIENDGLLKIDEIEKLTPLVKNLEEYTRLNQSDVELIETIEDLIHVQKKLTSHLMESDE